MSEPTPFLSSGGSRSGSAPAGEPSTVDAGQGWAWIASGFELFMKRPGIWIAIVVVMFVIMIVLSVIPVLGSLALVLLMPVFTGGLMLGCRSLAKDGTLEFSHLFAGFKSQTGSLVTLGAISIAAWIVVMLPVLAIVGFGAFFGSSHSLASAGGIGGFLLAGLIAFALSIVIYMGLWFAPALIVLGEEAPVTAIKQSFAACMKNFVPFLVYGIVVLVLSILATIPFGLGWLVLGPVIAASVYTAYRDIFGD